MSTTLDSRMQLNVLQQSPLDALGCPPEPVETTPELQHWMPSRYNIRATADDGRLILWNTLSGSMSVFKAEQAPRILELLKKDGFTDRKEGLVKYLVDRGFLTRNGANEYRQFQLLFGQQHYRNDALLLTLLASEDCNFRCKYCYEDFARGTMRPDVRNSVKRMVESRAKSLNLLHVSWFGGEPLYGWAAVEELAPFFVELAERNTFRYVSGMCTNGYLLTQDRIEKLLKWNVRQYQVTIDGIPEDHDHNRPTRDGHGTFDTILRNLHALSMQDETFHVAVRVNFSPRNYSRMGEFFELLSATLRNDARFSLYFRPVGRWGGASDDALEVCQHGDVNKLAQDLGHAAAQFGLRVQTLKELHSAGSQVCYAARPHHWIIGATGKVMKCTLALDKNDRNVVGKLTEAGELELDPEKVALWAEPAFEGRSQCQQCSLLPSCQGISCPLHSMQSQEPPCISTRHNARRELLETLTMGSGLGGSRQLIVEG